MEPLHSCKRIQAIKFTHLNGLGVTQPTAGEGMTVQAQGIRLNRHNTFNGAVGFEQHCRKGTIAQLDEGTGGQMQCSRSRKSIRSELQVAMLASQAVEIQEHAPVPPMAGRPSTSDLCYCRHTGCTDKQIFHAQWKSSPEAMM